MRGRPVGLICYQARDNAHRAAHPSPPLLTSPMCRRPCPCTPTCPRRLEVGLAVQAQCCVTANPSRMSSNMAVCSINFKQSHNRGPGHYCVFHSSTLYRMVLNLFRLCGLQAPGIIANGRSRCCSLNAGRESSPSDSGYLSSSLLGTSLLITCTAWRKSRPLFGAHGCPDRQHNNRRRRRP